MLPPARFPTNIMFLAIRINLDGRKPEKSDDRFSLDEGRRAVT